MFAAGRLWEVGANTVVPNPEDVLWRLVPCQRYLHPAHKIRMARTWRFCSLPDESNDLLAQPWVLGTDYGHFVNARMSEQALLNLGWRDVFASYECCC
jgi:hypothetical protein